MTIKNRLAKLEEQTDDGDGGRSIIVFADVGRWIADGKRGDDLADLELRESDTVLRVRGFGNV